MKIFLKICFLVCFITFSTISCGSSPTFDELVEDCWDGDEDACEEAEDFECNSDKDCGKGGYCFIGQCG